MIGTSRREIALTDCFPKSSSLEENAKDAEVREKAVIAACSPADVIFERDYCYFTSARMG